MLGTFIHIYSAIHLHSAVHICCSWQQFQWLFPCPVESLGGGPMRLLPSKTLRWPSPSSPAPVPPWGWPCSLPQLVHACRLLLQGAKGWPSKSSQGDPLTYFPSLQGTSPFFQSGLQLWVQHVKCFSWPSSPSKQQLPYAGNAALLRLTEITYQTKIGRDTNNEMAKQRVGSNSWNVMGLKIRIQRILFVLLNNANILAFGLEKCSNRLTYSPISCHVY